MPNGNLNLLPNIRLHWKAWPIVVHSARTAVAAVVPLVVALLVRLPEAYWAPVTTLVIIAFHRFAEVSIGITGALLFAPLWPEEADATSTNQ